jgi:DNA invertase Pin-like site-specific DNA recombinase
MVASSIGYARVSTAEQAYQVALSTQVFRLQQAGAVKVYADVASRTKDNRAALMEILSMVAAGEIKKVLITRIDRITSSPGLFERISQVFQKHGVVLEALDEHVDIYSVDGEFSAGLQVYFARREVRTIQLRVKKAIEAGRQNNKASNKAPWGYRSMEGRYELDHTPFLCLLEDRPPLGEEFSGRTKAELGRDIVDLFFQGGSLYEAIKLINSKYGIYKFKTEKETERSPQILVFEDGVTEFKPTINRRAGLFRWTQGGIRIYLLNPVLVGDTPYNTHNDLKADGNRNRKPQEQWDIRYNTHPNQALMTRTEQSRIKNILTINQEVGCWSGSGATTFSMTGIIACADCGRTMKCEGLKITKNGNQLVYYQCKNYKEKACSNKRMVRLDCVEQHVIEAIAQRAAAIAEYASTPPEYVEPPELQQLRSQLAGLEALGHNSAIEAAKAEMQSQIQALVVKLQQQQVVDGSLRQMLLDTFSDPLYWEGLLDDRKREIYRALVKRVTIRDGAVVEVELRV